MHKGRLEAFSDGVIAVIITIMVLELHVPYGADQRALLSFMPNLSIYLLSFIFIGIYWNNHHHMLQAVDKVNGRALWANHHLLFWLSLIPFATAWLGSHPYETIPTAFYGVLLFASAVAFTILQNVIVAFNGRTSRLQKALGHDDKGKLSIMLYLIGIACAFFAPLVSYVVFVVVAIMWWAPDPRIEHVMLKHPPDADKNTSSD